jgi:hypothetical protein
MSEGDARPRTFERFDVQRVLIVLGCAVTTSGLGLERTNLRRVADDTEFRGFFLLRIQLWKPIFQTTLRDIQKDKK